MVKEIKEQKAGPALPARRTRPYRIGGHCLTREALPPLTREALPPLTREALPPLTWGAVAAPQQVQRDAAPQLVAVVAGAVWYATGSLYSVYTAAEYSIWSFEHGALAPPWHAIAASSGVLSRDLAKAGALARRSWFTSCLGLSDMPIPTPTEHLPPQSTRYSSCSSRGLHAHGV